MIRSTLTSPLCHRPATPPGRAACRTGRSAASKETLTTRERDTQCLPITSTRADRRASAGSSDASCPGPRPPMPPARWSTGRRPAPLSTVALDPAGLPVRLGRLLRPRRARRPAVRDLGARRAHPQPRRRPPGQPARHRARRAPATDPLARGRVTLVGDAAPVPDAEQEAAVALVAARVPAVAGYAGYGDFRCFRLAVRADPLGRRLRRDGLGRRRRLRRRRRRPVLPHRHGIAAHMNDDHADAGVAAVRAGPRRARRRRRRCATSTATAASTSPTSPATTASPSSASAFSEPATSNDDVRRLVVELVHAARAR